jgi:PAS domain S-box-containing protein
VNHAPPVPPAASRPDRIVAQAILDGITDALFAIDAGWRITFVNAAGSRLARQPDAALFGADLWTHVPALAGATLEDRCRRAMRERSSCAFDVFDGTLDAWTRVHVHPCGEGLALRLQDVTEQHAEAERMARSIEIQQRIATTSLDTRQVIDAVLTNLPDMAWLKDRDSRFLAGNDAIAAAMGTTRQALVGTTDFEHWPADIAAGYVADDQLVFATGQRLVREEPMVRHDGRRIWIETVKSPYRDGTGQFVGVVGTARDVTARVEAEVSFRRQALTFATIHDAVIVTGPDGAVLDWNPAAERIFGYDRAEVVGLCATFLGTAAGECERVLAAAAQGARWSGEYHFRRKDGRERVCESVVVPVSGESGEPDGAIWVSRDVTDHKRLQAKLLQAQKLEAIGQLGAGIAHEINTPTQYVGDNLQFAEQALADLLAVLAAHQPIVDACRADGRFAAGVAHADAVAAQVDQAFLEVELPLALRQALEGIERIAEIVRGMKAFSHPGAGALTATDLNQQLEHALELSRSAWRDTADLVWDADPSLPLVFCHVGEVNQVLLNVIVNAAHAIADSPATRAGARGEIRVSSRRDGAWVELRVGDTGGGIPEELRSRIFDPFFTTREVGRGTGQGLTIALAIVEKHGGSITFDTVLGVGTTFVIRLPIAGAAGTADAASAGRETAA